MILSVCLFTYNHGAFIAQAIESVLMQETDFNFEIVIGEDCSTDGTREIVADYQKRYPGRIRALLNERNMGLMENNAYTLCQCKGKYVALLDGDDYWINSRKLHYQVHFLESHPGYTLCFHDCKILNTEGEFLDHTCCGPDIKQTVTFTDIICDVHIPTASVMLRRDVLNDFPPAWFYSLKAPDRPLFLLATSVGPAYYFNNHWGVYRKHMGGAWTNQSYLSRWLVHLQIYSVTNRHFNDVYRSSYCKCQNGIFYFLAIQLMKDKEFKRALCFFRKYIRNKKTTQLHLSTIRRIISCFIFYKLKVFRARKRTASLPYW